MESVVLAPTRIRLGRTRLRKACNAAKECKTPRRDGPAAMEGDGPKLRSQPRQADPPLPRGERESPAFGGDDDSEPACGTTRCAMAMLNAINHPAHPWPGKRLAEPRVLGRSVRRNSDRVGPGSTACPTVAQEAA